MSASRPNFLKTFGVLPLVATLGRRAEDLASTSSPLRRPAAHFSPARRLLSNRSSSAGFRHDDGPTLVHRLGPPNAVVYEIDYGSEDTEEFVYHGVRSIDLLNLRLGLQPDLKAEPGNPHDLFAVEIFLGKIKLGYVPRNDNKHISRLLDQCANLDCQAIEIDPRGGGVEHGERRGGSGH